VKFLADLERRGLLYDSTPGAASLLDSGMVTGYVGFDPTASSLHVGSLIQILALRRLQMAGHRPIAVVGGGTGLIGDPSGKTSERTLLTHEILDENVNGIRAQLERFLDFESGDNRALLLNNADWLGTQSLIEFLRDTGKYFNVATMLSKDSVQRRLQAGLSFTEFAYALLQAYDFKYLFETHDCRLQIGGSDQWGNIVAGIDFIRRTRNAEAEGVVQPLLTTASGAKFGKNEEGTIWLDAERTSPYAFYQFWYNSDDRDVIRLLRYFTERSESEIADLERALADRPEDREAQRILARDVTALVHDADAFARAEKINEHLFRGDIRALDAEAIRHAFAEVPSTTVPRSRLADGGVGVLELANESGATASNGEARRLINNGGLALNGERVTDPQATVGADALIDDAVLVLRKGKKNHYLVWVEG